MECGIIRLFKHAYAEAEMMRYFARVCVHKHIWMCYFCSNNHYHMIFMIFGHAVMRSLIPVSWYSGCYFFLSASLFFFCPSHVFSSHFVSIRSFIHDFEGISTFTINFFNFFLTELVLWSTCRTGERYPTCVWFFYHMVHIVSVGYWCNLYHLPTACKHIRMQRREFITGLTVQTAPTCLRPDWLKCVNQLRRFILKENFRALIFNYLRLATVQKCIFVEPLSNDQMDVIYSRRASGVVLTFFCWIEEGK